MWRSLLLLVVACSSSPAETCRPPTQTTYSCQPLSGSAGPGDCTGGPTWSPTHAATDALHQDDPDKIFPAGCNALLPDCSPYYKSEARMQQCTGGHWSEPI